MQGRGNEQRGFGQSVQGSEAVPSAPNSMSSGRPINWTVWSWHFKTTEPAA